jgi:Fe-S cluster biogenesis protein NfuA
MFDKEKIQSALDEVRPALQADGGDVELVDIAEDGVVTVQLQGACHGCPMSQLTLSNGVERILRDRVSDEIRVKSADMPEDFDPQEFFNSFYQFDEDEVAEENSEKE